MNPNSYTRLHYPSSIVQHAVWPYLRFNLSLRDVEDLLAERGLDISYETVRRWGARIGPAYARRLRAMRPRPCDTWHFDEMFVLIGGRMMYLLRAVDAEGEVLDVLVQPRRDKRATLKLMRRLLRKQGFPPEAIVTDKLRSYSAALQCRAPRGRYERSARDPRPAEQSRREFAPTSPPTRTIVDRIQETGIDPALPLCSRRRLQHLQRPAPSDLTPNPSGPTERRVRTVAIRGQGSMALRGSVGFVRAGSGFVTTPSQSLYPLSQGRRTL